MDFVANQKPQIDEMLRELGIETIDALFAAIPEQLKHAPPQEDDGMSEWEVMQHMEKLAAENNLERASYLGAGAYAHHIPAMVSPIISRSEFLTSYTAYQPEASQGMLQTIFEFQSAIAALTAMDVSNASVYDAASACAEAILMALRIQKGKKRVLIADSVHPSYRKAVKLYLEDLEVDCTSLPHDEQGSLDRETYARLLNSETTCVLIQSPNFFGIVENMREWTQSAHAQGALFIACGNPMPYALFESPGEYGADIAVGDCQPLGIPLQFGGPYAGYMACRETHVRQLPGRIVGQTVDAQGERGFVLTLQAREQHIRREKATSNICTNQALAALASLITILWYGPKGLHQLALTNYQRAHYLSSELARLPGFSIWPGHFNEFVLKLPCETAHFLHHLQKANIEPGFPLERFYPQLKNHLLIAVTETKSLEQLNHYVRTAKELF
jgi:glycine dehydrogenase subunit 1